MKDDRMKKMEFLKRKNRRNNVIKELDFMKLPTDPLLEIEENDLFCKQVFLKLSSIRNKIILQGMNYEENINKSVQTLRNIQLTTDTLSKEGRVFFFGEQEIEAVKLNVNEVFRNLEEILKLTKFATGYADFILVADDLHFGICIERTEYHYELSIWGLPSAE
ncbi:hypothetical protein J6TS7_66130 [Paenibacillus dendritiformis]|nr:hypothetical protein J6TS7_66130 [Paenibacillus dendritiformis]